MTISIKDSLTLASGLTLPNRLVKAAMTEGLADSTNQASAAHVNLYRRWSEGGIGMQITGNVVVDRRNLERPGNIVIDGPQSDQARAALSAMAEAAKSGGSPVIMQISHAGRQTPKSVNERPSAPSSVKLEMPGGQFGVPREMSEKEVRETIGKFAHAAKVAHETGFDGIQIHAAHGYLISQFLSPIANRREDEWGGPLENRARFLVETIRSCRLACGSDFTIGVKLNSSDFQKGGFSHEDCLLVIDILNNEGIDFVEVSGGNYEQPKLMGIELPGAIEERVRESTRAREAYFAAYARSVKTRAAMPVMATGGFRTLAAIKGAVEDQETDLIGLARPMCANPNLPKEFLEGARQEAQRWEKTLRIGPTRWLSINSPLNLIKGINGWGQMGWFTAQLHRMGEGLEPDHKIGILKALRMALSDEKKRAKAYHAHLNDSAI